MNRSPRRDGVLSKGSIRDRSVLLCVLCVFVSSWFQTDRDRCGDRTMDRPGAGQEQVGNR